MLTWMCKWELRLIAPLSQQTIRIKNSQLPPQGEVSWNPLMKALYIYLYWFIIDFDFIYNLETQMRISFLYLRQAPKSLWDQPPTKTEITQAVWLNGKMPTSVSIMSAFHNRMMQKDQTMVRIELWSKEKRVDQKHHRGTSDINERERKMFIRGSEHLQPFTLLWASSRLRWLVRLEANCGWKSEVGHCSSC